MQIQGLGQIHTAQGINAPHNPQIRPASEGLSRPAIVDQFDISPAAEAAIQATSNDSFRADLVARIRTEIASGTYETAQKLDLAVDRLLDEIG